MNFELEAKTDAGKKFVEVAERLRPVLRENADQADRDGEMSTASFTALSDAGLTAAFVPESLGGLGLSSVHDWLVGIASLAAGDGSTTIALNMHLGVSRGMAQAYLLAQQSDRSAQGPALPLQAFTAGRILICATATERGTDNLHPLTTATATETGWIINGLKMFVTMSPLATHIAMNLRMQDEQGDHLATTLLPIDTPGISPQNDWDALGMRGSGSQSVKFENVEVARSAVADSGPGDVGARPRSSTGRSEIWRWWALSSASLRMRERSPWTPQDRRKNRPARG